MVHRWRGREREKASKQKKERKRERKQTSKRGRERQRRERGERESKQVVQRSACAWIKRLLFALKGVNRKSQISWKLNSTQFYQFLSSPLLGIPRNFLMFDIFFSYTEKNLSNEIEGTSKFICYRRISLQPI